jgi:hypothetical protein
MDTADIWLDRARDLGTLLAERGEHHTLLVVGGFAMQYHGLGSRTMTQDIDAWGRVDSGTITNASPLPESLKRAVDAVGRLHGVSRTWLNSQVAATLHDKPWPDGILERATAIELNGLTLLVIDRRDLVFLKLAAAVQPGVFAPRAVGEKHRTDLRDLAPTNPELHAAIAWIRSAFGPTTAAAAQDLMEEDY